MTHFLESNTRMMPDFLYVIMYKKKEKSNIKLNFEENKIDLLNMRRKIKRKRKRKLFVQNEKLKKLNNFHNINSQ